MNLGLKRYKSRKVFLEEVMDIDLTPFEKKLCDLADEGKLPRTVKPEFRHFDEESKKKFDNE